MGRRPAADVLVNIIAAGETFPVPESVLNRIPGTAQFLAWLVAEEKIAPGIALRYAKLVAKCKSRGELDDPNRIMREPDRTAARKYALWSAQAYDDRLRPVIKHWLDRKEIGLAGRLKTSAAWLRISNLVPPYPNKTVPCADHEAARRNNDALLMAIHDAGPGAPTPTVPLEPTLMHVPCAQHWTLHLPAQAGTPVHQDPCNECEAVVLDEAALQVVAAAYRNAWGDRHPSSLPADSLLFGMLPPVGTAFARNPDTLDGEVMLCLADRGAIAAICTRAGAVVLDNSSEIEKRLAQQPAPRALFIDLEARDLDVEALCKAIQVAQSARRANKAAGTEAPLGARA